MPDIHNTAITFLRGIFKKAPRVPARDDPKGPDHDADHRVKDSPSMIDAHDAPGSRSPVRIETPLTEAEKKSQNRKLSS